MTIALNQLNPLTTPKPRPVLTIVKGLQLDHVKVPGSNKSRQTAIRAKGPRPLAGNGGDILESGRNNTLTSMAGAMRRKGMAEDTIEAALQAENLARCKPPLDSEEVRRIAASIARYPAADADGSLKPLTDINNAARFGLRYKDQVRYVFGMGWMIWDGLCWKRDETDQIMELAKQLACDLSKELLDGSARVSSARHANAIQQAPRLRAMVDLARSLPEFVTKERWLDVHDMLLGVANGVINLKTGKLHPPRPEDLMVRHSRVIFDGSAKCPRFDAFIDQITDGDRAVAAYLRRVIGYSLTGSTSEQCVFFLHGNGANGKSTFLNIIKELLGADLAKQTPTETLMVTRPNATNDLARLQRLRMVIANEVEDGSLLGESLIKQMTGGEAVAARFLYCEYFEFTPKFKLFIAGNHKPVIRGRDNGIWRRIRMIPFEVEIPPLQRDHHLLEKLRAELPGILNWALKGCRDWQKAGLHEPKTVTDAVDSYREEMDVIGQWSAECCAVGPTLKCKASDAYQSYKYWAERNGYRPMAIGTFGREFASRFNRVKRKDGNYFLGVRAA